jgi:hypothetical protein
MVQQSKSAFPYLLNAVHRITTPVLFYPSPSIPLPQGARELEEEGIPLSQWEREVEERKSSPIKGEAGKRKVYNMTTAEVKYLVTRPFAGQSLIILSLIIFLMQLFRAALFQTSFCPACRSTGLRGIRSWRLRAVLRWSGPIDWPYSSLPVRRVSY